MSLSQDQKARVLALLKKYLSAPADEEGLTSKESMPRDRATH